MHPAAPSLLSDGHRPSKCFFSDFAEAPTEHDAFEAAFSSLCRNEHSHLASMSRMSHRGLARVLSEEGIKDLPRARVLWSEFPGTPLQNRLTAGVLNASPEPGVSFP